MIVNDLEKHKATPRFERGINEYAGPDFGTLDEVSYLFLWVASPNHFDLVPEKLLSE
jgi:hypothetical protein